MPLLVEENLLEEKAEAEEPRNKRSRFLFFGAFALSFFIVAWGQPARFAWLGFFAACGGYALLWKAAEQIVSLRLRFWMTSLWFALVQAVQLSWMTSLQYQGIGILFVYGLLLVVFGVQFGFFSLWISSPFLSNKRMGIAAIASLWTLLEWGRLFVFCGFSWNPVGMALSYHPYSMQSAVLFGVYGLSFWVFISNLVGYRALSLPFSWNRYGLWIFCALSPLCFGWIHQKAQENRGTLSQDLSVVLVQTGLWPDQKEPLQSTEKALHPLKQWARILGFLQDLGTKKIDLMVFPENAVPCKAFFPMYSLEEISALWSEKWGRESLSFFPPLHEPFARYEGNNQWWVTNGFIAQAIANYFHAQVIIGLDDYDFRSGNYYNAAYSFLPNSKVERYEKRVLVPVAEYLPFSWCRKIAAHYGIGGCFSPGTEAKVFCSSLSVSPSICYEETFGYLMRQGRQKGAEVFVNLTNDGWFPLSRLPLQHFTHGILRAVENGVPLVRSCNTGVTGGVDCFGRVIKTLGSPFQAETQAGALFLFLPINHYSTLYTFWGDGGIVTLSSLCFCFFCFGKKKKKVG